jgi:hypothetical protein
MTLIAPKAILSHTLNLPLSNGAKPKQMGRIRSLIKRPDVPDNLSRGGLGLRLLTVASSLPVKGLLEPIVEAREEVAIIFAEK